MPAQVSQDQLHRNDSINSIKHTYVWQSLIEINYYSVMYFKHITDMDTLSFC